MANKITKENFLDAKYDIFRKFSEQWAIVSAGSIDDYNCMTLSWGMMGNVWEHPGAAVTIYVRPDRYTFEFMEKNDYFVISFLPEENRKDAEILGTVSGRDGDKVAKTSLTPVKLEKGVGFAQSELTFVCRKVFAQQFDVDCVPEKWRDGVYSSHPAHYMYIGYIEDAFGEV